MAEIITQSQLKELSNKFTNTIQSEQAQQTEMLRDLLQTASALSPSDADDEVFASLNSLLSLPNDQFALIAPAVLEELESQYNDVNTQLLLMQTLNAQGIKYEDLQTEYLAICDTLDEISPEVLSIEKRSFLKALISLIYNSTSVSTGLSKRTISIPIEFCHANAKMPTYAHLTDAGMDVYALEDITIMPGETKLIPLGIKVAIPAGYELQVRPKSGRSLKTKLRIANAPGTIDAGYRDEVGVIIDNIEPFIKTAEMDTNGRLYNIEFGQAYTIGQGEKFAQLVLSEVPKVAWTTVDTVLNNGENRGGGFGSTGLK